MKKVTKKKAAPKKKGKQDSVGGRGSKKSVGLGKKQY